MSEKKSKKESLELPISSEELIIAVQNRPFLYDSSLEAFNDKKKKVAAWLEICEEVIPNWSTLRSENSFIEFELQKKWRNLRDCFTRAYKKQLSAIAQGKKPPRPYVYYELLSFLLPLISKRYSALGTKVTSIRNETDDDSNEAEYLNYTDEQLEVTKACENIKGEFHEILIESDSLPDEDSFGTRPESVPLKNVNLKLKRNLTRKRVLSTTLSAKNEAEPESKKITLNDNINNLVESMNRQSNDAVKDPDEMFLLGMLPHLKKIKEDKRLDVQIEIMQLLNNRIHDQEFD